MVLQRGKPDTIWGWSQPGDTVRVEIGGHRAAGAAGSDGRWQVKINPPKAGGPYTLKIAGRQSVELKNVMVGDVWLCGGQSNMQLGFDSREWRGCIRRPIFPRSATLPWPKSAYRHSDVVEGSWKVVSPDRRALCRRSRIYFARRLQRDIHVPIGLVVDAVGGTFRPKRGPAQMR